jgi:predicted permease
METLLQDIRFGVRMLRKNPPFTLVAVLTLALGIGANTAIFTLVNAVLLRMLPVKDPGQLVVIGNPETVHSRSQGSPTVDYFSAPLYRDLNEGSGQVLSGMLASGEVHRVRVRGGSGDITSDATGVLVSGNYFSVLGVNAGMGRVFTEDGAKGANPVAVLSYGFWKDKLGGNPGIVGQEFSLNEHIYTVIGVTPPGFFGDAVGDAQDVWIPLSMQEQFLAGRSWLNDYSASWLHLIGRLRPGVSVANARAALNVGFQQVVNGPVGARFSKSDRDDLRKAKIEVEGGGRGFSELRGDFFQPLMLLGGMVGLVLVMACVNVANLLLARAAARRNEFAVRAALGAAPFRLFRQLITESIILAFAGGLLGLLVARWATSALLALSGNGQLDASPDLRVLAFTAAICLATGVLFGMIPAWRSRRVAVAPTLKSGAQTGETASGSVWNWGKALVVLQVSISLLVLFAASLLSRSLRNLRNVDLGYSHEHILLVNTDPVAAGYDLLRTAAFADRMSVQFAAIPGVRAASYSKNGLFSGSESNESIAVEGFSSGKEEDLQAYDDYVGPGYFGAVGIPIVLGRDIGPQDTAASHKVAVINQSMAKFYFGNANPIGRTFTVGDEGMPKEPWEIVGVSEDARDHELKGAVQRRFYRPLVQAGPSSSIKFEIKTAGDPVAVAEIVRKQIEEFDARVPVYTTRSLDQLLDGFMNTEILIARLSGFFGIVALGLACVGLYGIMSYAVSGRTREIGVRMALGAQRSSMLWMVLRQGARLVLIGALAGIPLALAANSLLSSMLFGLKTTDPVSMVMAVLVLVGVALLAALIPARRATRVDPMVALRYE